MPPSEKVVVIVPVREGSQRIKDKNFRPFGGHPTFIHNKIDQLKRSRCFSHIYVSSDSSRIQKITEDCGAEFLPRDPKMCSGEARWDEVVVTILGDVPGNPHVGWAMVTSPLYSRYAAPVERYLSSLGTYDSLVCVKKVREYLIDERCRPLFGGFGVWHPYTSELSPLYAISDTFFIAPKSDQLIWRYWFGKKPFLFENSWMESVDVNFKEDLEMAYALESSMAKKGLL